jgi:hypothetical protein
MTSKEQQISAKQQIAVNEAVKISLIVYNHRSRVGASLSLVSLALRSEAKGKYSRTNLRD